MALSTLGNTKWIKLNVGGKPFLTTLDTLMTYPDSSLAKMFDPDSGFQPPYSENGVYFLNANPIFFGIILDWLRYKKIMAPSDTDLGSLAHIADYYGIVELIQALPPLQPCAPVGQWIERAGLDRDKKVRGMFLKLGTDEEPRIEITQLPDGKLSAMTEDGRNWNGTDKCFTSDAKGPSVWVPTKAGQLPPKAISFKGKDGEKLYVGRRLWVADWKNNGTSVSLQVFCSEGGEPVIPNNTIISLGYVNEEGVWDIHFNENVEAIMELSHENEDFFRFKEIMMREGKWNDSPICTTSHFEVLCIF